MHNVRTNSELQVRDVPVGLFFLRGNRIDMGGGGTLIFIAWKQFGEYGRVFLLGELTSLNWFVCAFFTIHN